MYKNKHDVLLSKEGAFVEYAMGKSSQKDSLSMASLTSGAEQRQIFYKSHRKDRPIILSLIRDDDGRYVINLHDTDVYGEMFEEVYGNVAIARKVFKILKWRIIKALKHNVFYLLDGLPKEED